MNADPQVGDDEADEFFEIPFYANSVSRARRLTPMATKRVPIKRARDEFEFSAESLEDADISQSVSDYESPKKRRKVNKD